MSESVRSHRRPPTRLHCPWDCPGKNTGVGCHFLLQCMKMESESEVAQSCPTLSDPMDYSLPVSSIHGILQARLLEWGAIAFSHAFIYHPVNIFLIADGSVISPNWLQVFLSYISLSSHINPLLLLKRCAHCLSMLGPPKQNATDQWLHQQLPCHSSGG